MSIKKETAKQEERMKNQEWQLMMREEKAQNHLEVVKECSDYFFTENGLNEVLRVGDLVTTDHE